MKHVLKASVALGLIGAVVPAYAQEATDLGEVTIYSSTVPVPLDRTGTTTEVIGTRELERGGTQELVTKLDRLPGVSFSGNGPLGTQRSLSLRGLGAKYVPVYFNGIDMTDTTGTQIQFNWGGVLTSGVGRVEVLKGAQSALYGSEAIGGVINLSSPTLDEVGQKVSFSAEVGSYETYAMSLGYVQKTERADLSFSLGRLKTDGFSAAEEDDGNTEADGFDGTTLSFAGSYAATDRLTLGGALLYSDAELNIDAFGGAGGDADRPYYTTRMGARLFGRYEGDVITHELSFSYSDTHKRDPLSAFSKDFDGQRKELAYLGQMDLNAGTLSFGLKHSRENASIDGSYNEIDTNAAFAEAVLGLSEAVDLSLAGRFEDNSKFGSAVTGRAAVAWRASDATTVRASLGNGFRAPSLYELYGPFGSATLQEERSKSFDFGVEHQYAAGHVITATAFYSEIDNLIDYDFATSAYNQVAGTSKVKGVELSGQFVLSDRMTLEAAYTYTDAKDRSGNQLRRVPKHDLSLALSASVTPKLDLGVEVNYVAGRANDGFPSRAMPDYTVVNATFDYAISDGVSAYVRVENLFDTEYQTSAGYGTSDRAAYFGIRAEF